MPACIPSRSYSCANAFACLLLVLLLVPLLVYRGRSLLRSERFDLYGVRVVVSLLSMQGWFYALSLIPIGELTAISYLAPLFGTLGAVFLLGETVRFRRWTALGVGFLGAIIILRPSGAAMGVGQLCALFSAVMSGLTAVLVKQLTARDDPGPYLDRLRVWINRREARLEIPPHCCPAAFAPAVGLHAVLDLGYRHKRHHD